MRRIIGLGLGLATALLAASCSSGAVAVSDAWARTSASTQETGAVYMIIEGGDQADLLTGVSVSGSVAAMAQLHETSMSEDGLMSMQPVTAIAIPSGGTVELAPGGLHVMLMQLTQALETGSTFVVQLTFEQAGVLEVEVTVRDE